MESDAWFYRSSNKTWERKDLDVVYPKLEPYARGGATCEHGHTFFFKSNFKIN